MNRGQTWARALRLPFLPASLLPFAVGAAAAPQGTLERGLVGLVCVGATHLAANLVNDLADSASGADAKDLTHYGFFGGSKLIVNGTLSARAYRRAAGVAYAIGLVAAAWLGWRLGRLWVAPAYLAVALASWAYSAGRARFSYRGLGELAIFLLFGPVPVVGGYFAMTGTLNLPLTLLLSVPLGFLTAAILFANEVPDHPDDRQAGKRTLVDRVGPARAWRVYAVLMAAAFVGLALNIRSGTLSPAAAAAFLNVMAATRALKVLRRSWNDKPALVQASRQTIFVQTCVGVIMWLDLSL